MEFPLEAPFFIDTPSELCDQQLEIKVRALTLLGFISFSKEMVK